MSYKEVEVIYSHIKTKKQKKVEFATKWFY